MAEAAKRSGSVLGADVARRLIARPIQRQVARGPHVAPNVTPQETSQEPQAEPPATNAIAMPDLARKLEAEIMVMMAVVAAERRENENLRAWIGMDDETLGAEARAVRDRWAGLVDKLLHEAV